MGRNKGVCSICGKGGKLTFEHIPPKAAYNETGVELYGIEDWLRREDGGLSGGAPQPDGSGLYSICKSCNELSGAHYLPAFAKLVHAGIDLHSQIRERWGDDGPDKQLKPRVATVGIKAVRPLLLAKQMLAMLLAVNGPHFGRKNAALVNFVLDPHSRGLPDRYRLFLSLFSGPMARFVGLSVVVRPGGRSLLTEVAYPPFAYLLTVDSPPELPVGDITAWADADRAEVHDVTVDLMIAFGHTPLPGDYRSRASVDAEAARNRAVSGAE